MPDRWDVNWHSLRRSASWEVPCLSMNARWTCYAPSSRTMSPPRSRWAAGPSSSATTCRSRRRRCATTWPSWRRRATSASRTPAPGGCRPTVGTGCSSTRYPGSSHSRRPSAGNEKLVGHNLTEAPPAVQALVEEISVTLRPAMTALSTVLLETLVERGEERVVLAGTANLTRAGLLDFQGSLRPILEALEEEVILLKLFGQIEPSLMRVRIGDENEIEDLRTTSVVATGYGPGSTVVGGMGVLGPTRMDYPGNIATVRAVARYVGDLLAHS